MTAFNALYYPTWNPPVDYLRAVLLFFDRFEVIIPEGVPAEYHEANQRVFDLIPDAFMERRERHYDIEFEGEAWEHFERALDLIVEDRRPRRPSERSQLSLFPGVDEDLQDWPDPAPPSFSEEPSPSGPQVRIHFGDDRRSRIGNHVLMHGAKMSGPIMRALRIRRLLRPDLQHISDEAGKRGFHVVDERASCLILSLLADSLARWHGLRTITDEPLGYTLNALNGQFVGSRRAVEMSLASTIISTEIPDAVGRLSPEEYVELRKRFSEVRQPFQRAVGELCDDHRLYGLTNQNQLSEAVTEIAEEYRKAVERFRSSSSASQLLGWTPFGIGVLGGALGITGNITLGAIGFGLGVAVQVYERFNASKPEDTVERSQRLVSGLRRELLPREILSKLATPRKS